MLAEQPLALVIADAVPGAGLGHVSRASGVAVALAARGFEVRCLAYGATDRFERDGLSWSAIDRLPEPGADLVVLSACRTALGEEIRGEGLVGLVRGFMYAGSPRVVASLWDVRDDATAEGRIAYGHDAGLAPGAQDRRRALGRLADHDARHREIGGCPRLDGRGEDERDEHARSR